MKKIYALSIILCIVSVLLAACNDPGEVVYPDELLKDSVVSVFLIDYNSKNIRSFELNQMTIIKELDAENLTDFWHSLSNILVYNRPSVQTPAGRSIQIVYSNGEFDVMSCNNTDHIDSFLARYDSSGKRIKLIGSIEKESEFEELIDRYFDTP